MNTRALAAGVVGLVGGLAGLTAGPTCYRRLKGAEDVDVDVVSAATAGDEILQAVLVVIFVGEFENGFFDLLGEPDDGVAGLGIVPFEAEIFKISQ